MTGAEVVAWCAGLSPEQVTALRLRAHAGDVDAVCLWVAYGAWLKAKREQRPMAALESFFDNLTLKVEVA